MPKVGKGLKAVNYPYSSKGIKDAFAHSQRTGEPISMEYKGGGMVPRPKYNLGGMVPRRPIPRPTPGTGMTPPTSPGIMGGAPGAGASVGMNRMGQRRKYHDLGQAPIGGYRKGGKVKKR
tara:strand:- start:73 stop:432 length:360 start_codon:yes stop_codon:yes gene_type:complete